MAISLSGFRKKKNYKPGTITPKTQPSAIIYQLHPNISTGSTLYKSWSNPCQTLQKSMVLTSKILGFPVDSPLHQFWERSHPPNYAIIIDPAMSRGFVSTKISLLSGSNCSFWGGFKLYSNKLRSMKRYSVSISLFPSLYISIYLI